MSILEKFLEIAQHELGVHESTGTESTKRILEYDATTTLKAQDDHVPWCSAFVNWVVTQAGLKGTNSAAAKSWLDWGKSIEEPVRGCIVVYKRGDDVRLGHVNFFLSQTKLFVTGIGGNQHDSVSYGNYPKYDVLDYRVPNEN